MTSRRFAASFALPLALSALMACGSNSSDADAAGSSGKSFCEIAKSANNLNEFFENPPTKQEIERVGAIFKDLANAAPAEIKTEAEAVSKFVNDDFKLLADINTQTTDPAKLAELATKMTPILEKMTALEGQMKKFSEFVGKDCGIELE